jgi:DNA replication protein DnaC
MPNQGSRINVCSDKCYEAAFDTQLARAGVPPRYRKLTLDGFSTYTPSLRAKVEDLRDWVEDELRLGLYLFGNVGSGKTHLAVGVMRKLLQRGVKGTFCNAREFILNCQAVFSRNETVDYLVDRLLEERFLVLDDLGSEKATEYVRQSLLHLVDSAYTREKTLIVTSNLSLDHIGSMEPRLASRLAEMCELYEFQEDDYRVRLAQKRTEAGRLPAVGGVQ